MNKYFTYVRKSSEEKERQILSNPAQIKELQELNLKLKLDVINPPLEESQSAKIPGRPIFNAMLAAIEENKAQGIIVWHPDRLSRNSEDSAKIIALMDRGNLLEVITPSQIFRNNPMDKFMLGFFMMNAKLENDTKSVNVKRGLKAKAEKGWLPSGAKPGYMNDKLAEKGNKKLLKDPIRFDIIQKTWKLFLTGSYTVPQLLKILNNDLGYRSPKHKRKGGKPMARSQIYRMLADPFYYGYFEYPEGSENWHKGEHAKMIEKEEFDKAQVFLGRKGRPRPKKHDFPYTGIIECGECKAAITAEEHWQIICSECKTKFNKGEKTDACKDCGLRIEDMKNPKLLHYIHYRCTKKINSDCSQPSINANELEKQFSNILSKIQISERFKDWAIKYLNEAYTDEEKSRNATVTSLQDAYKDCVKRIDNLIKLQISPQNTNKELLTDEEFISQKNILLREKTELQQKMNSTDDRIDQWITLAEKAFDFASHAKYWFEQGDTPTKKQILNTIGLNLILKDKIVRMNIQKPYSFIETAVQEDLSISVKSEPEEKIANTIQLEALWAQNPIMLERWNDFYGSNWPELVIYPDVVMQQARHLLSV